MSHDAKRQPAQTCALKGIRAVARPAVAPIPDLHEDTPRGLFRRALVDPRSVRHAHGDMGTLLAFARRPPSLAATWRARCGFWPGSLIASPRLRAGRRLWRTRATCKNRIIQAVGVPTGLPLARLVRTSRWINSARVFSWTAPSALREATGALVTNFSVANR